MRLKKHEREKLKQLVADSILNRFTTEETLNYITNVLHVTFKPRYIQLVKQWLREDMQNQFTELRKDKFAYIHEYLNRINEIKDLQRGNRIMLGQTKDPHLQHRCMVELHALTLSLANLYDLLPAITERSFYDGNTYAPPEEMVSGTTEEEAAGSTAADQYTT
jgi:hypothetical protein